MDDRSWITSQKECWEEAYQRSPRVWKGAADIASCPAGEGPVLELGCGEGKTLLSLADSGRTTVGLDFSPNAVRKCASRCGYSDPVSLVIGDALRLPFADSSFEAVLALHVLDHLAEAERKEAVDEIERVLVGGGLTVIRVFSTEDMRAGKGREVESGTYLKGSGIICHFFTEVELAALLSRMTAESITERTAEKLFRGKRYRRVEMEGIFAKRGP